MSSRSQPQKADPALATGTRESIDARPAVITPPLGGTRRMARFGSRTPCSGSAPTPFGGTGVKFGHRSFGHAAECDLGTGVSGATTTDQPGRRVRDRSRDGARDHAGPDDRAHDGDHLHGLGGTRLEARQRRPEGDRACRGGPQQRAGRAESELSVRELLPRCRDAPAFANDDLFNRHSDVVGDSESCRRRLRLELRVEADLSRHRHQPDRAYGVPCSPNRACNRPDHHSRHHRDR